MKSPRSVVSNNVPKNVECSWFIKCQHCNRKQPFARSIHVVFLHIYMWEIVWEKYILYLC